MSARECPEGRGRPRFGTRFDRIHRSTIGNLEKVKELQPFFHGEYVVVLHSGATLKLSRRYRDRLEAHLGHAF